MKIEEIKCEVLKAGEGMIITDGKIYGRLIYLAKNRNPDEFHEISEDEYNEIKGGKTYDK